MDYDILSKFIRCKKYDVDSAASAFKNYYTHIFKNLDRVKGIKPSQYIAAFESRSCVFLKKAVNGSRVLLLQQHDWDTNLVHIREIQDGNFLLCEELFCDVEAQPHGSILLMDLAGFNFSHMKQLTPYFLKYAINTAVVSLSYRNAYSWIWLSVGKITYRFVFYSQAWSSYKNSGDSRSKCTQDLLANTSNHYEIFAS